jgi:hypothetical protein
MHVESSSATKSGYECQLFAERNPFNAYWRAAPAHLYCPPGLTIELAKSSLKEKRIVKQKDIEVLFPSALMVPLLFAIIPYLFLPLAGGGIPVRWHYECDYEPVDCNASRFPWRLLPVLSFGYSFLATMTAIYWLALGTLYFCAKTPKRYNRLIGKLKASLDAEEGSTLVPCHLLHELIPYLPEEPLRELSLEQMSAYREKYCDGFQQLLDGTALNPVQRTPWHLLAHIAKVKNNGDSQQRILSQKSPIKAMRAAPLLFEKILRCVKKRLVADVELQQFYCHLLYKKLLNKAFAKSLQDVSALSTMILNIAAGKTTLIDVQKVPISFQLGIYDFCLSAEKAELLSLWQAAGDRALIDSLTREEILLFIDYSVHKKLPQTQLERYFLLRALRFFNKTVGLRTVENKIAQDINALVASVGDLEELIQQLRAFNFLILEEALDTHLSAGIEYRTLDFLLEIYHKIAYYQLPKTTAALHRALKSQLESCAIDCSEAEPFAKILGTVAPLLPFKVWKSTLKNWMARHPVESEKLYLTAGELALDWLSKEISNQVRSNPTLKSCWINPSIDK